MKPTSDLAGKLLYSIVFIVLIPVFLWLWARYTSDLIRLPAISSKAAGWIMIISGGLLMLWAMAALWRLGRGLPMNAYPPALFVTGGPYRLLRHPIYWGFAILMIGFFLFTGSASGLWLVSPLTILGMIALVLGYEKPDLKKRFPDKALHTLLDLSANKDDVPELSDRLISLCLVFPFLILCNFLIITSGGIPEPLSGDFPQFFEVFQHPNLNLISPAFLATIPFALKRRDILRKWEISILLSLSYFLFIAVLFPSIGAQHLTRDNVILITVPVFLILISLKSLYNQSRATGAIFSLAAIIPVLIQLALSNSPIVYLVNSVIIFLLSAYYLSIWVFIKNLAEKIANSWQEWIFGKVRIINRGFYIAIGTFFGLLLAGYLAGREYVFVLLLFSVIVTITSGLWAQLIEGSAKLKRPFRFYD